MSTGPPVRAALCAAPTRPGEEYRFDWPVYSDYGIGTTVRRALVNGKRVDWPPPPGRPPGGRRRTPRACSTRSHPEPPTGPAQPKPTLAVASFGGANQLTGTSILIIVSVGLETVKQINSQIEQQSYEGFLR